jgi:beta-carotene 3-hydroxylase
MEFIAWSNHKYVMHGFLWSWHKDHHRKDKHNEIPENTENKSFEKNDLFFLVYAIPAIALMIIGFVMAKYLLVFIGIGITLYGFTYFLIHDVIIHKRLNIPIIQNNKGFIIKGIINAHSAHHWPKNKQDFKNFGLLFFRWRYFKN